MKNAHFDVFNITNESECLKKRENSFTQIKTNEKVLDLSLAAA